jgi:hypothetical protein
MSIVNFSGGQVDAGLLPIGQNGTITAVENGSQWFEGSIPAYSVLTITIQGLPASQLYSSESSNGDLYYNSFTSYSYFTSAEVAYNQVEFGGPSGVTAFTTINGNAEGGYSPLILSVTLAPPTDPNQFITFTEFNDTSQVAYFKEAAGFPGNFVADYSVAAAPSVATISATTDSGTTDLNAGHVITISLSLNEPVYVTGSPFLLLNDNEVASYATGSGTQNLTFKYTVHPGDNIADLQVSGLNLNGGTIQDTSGIPLVGSVQGDLALQIDTTPPTPFMSDVVKNSNNNLTTLSGMSEADSKVSVFDGAKPLGTVTADSSGDWSLQANISGGTHQFTETATDLAGNTGASAGATVYAPGGNKTLTGGSGNDFLIGGNNDTLIGGAGNDTFVFNQGFGKETVADFNPNQDHLAFNHALFTQYTAAQVLSQAHDTSAGAVILVDPHDTVTLTGVTVAQLQAAQTAHQNWLS